MATIPMVKKLQKNLKKNGISRKVHIAFLLCLGSLISFAQDSLMTAPSQEEDRIWFSTIPNTPEKSLQPYYDALKTATYGEQRFSIFDQLALYFIDKGTTDSVLFYGNLYAKETANWDKPESVRKNYASRAYYFLGKGSQLNGLPDNAIKWHIKGITAAEEGNNEALEYKNKIGLAQSYISKKEYTKAISILEEAIATFKTALPRPTNEALIYLGDIYSNLEEYSNAEEYYKDAQEGSQKFADLKQELFINLKLGHIAELQEDFDTAFSLYKDARSRGLENGFNIIYFEGTIRMGELLYKEGNYQAAIMALTTTYVNTIERENLHYQAEVLNIQRKIFSDMGDYQNAYAIMTQLKAVNQQVSDQQQKKITKELEVQYETLEKEKEILSLEEAQLKKESELKRQRTIKNAFLIGFLVILFPVIALLYVYYQKLQAQSLLAKTKEEINKQKVTTLMKEQELNLIKTSIEAQDEERRRIAQELHDSIGGNLAGIKLQLSSLDSEAKGITDVSNQLDETYQLVRDISHTLIPKRFIQNEFTSLVRGYTKSISDTGKLQIDFHPHPEETINQMDDTIRMEIFKVIQELLTNTIKHADATKVDIHLNAFEEQLHILFEDNGKGFLVTNIVDGIGFKNIKQRLTDLSGTLHIDSVIDRGTVISIEIPIKNSL